MNNYQLTNLGNLQTTALVSAARPKQALPKIRYTKLHTRCNLSVCQA